MADRPLAFLPDLAEEHLEELAFLWGQRREALRSPKYRQKDLIRLEGRIEAHVDGLLIPGEHLPEIVRPGLEGDDADAAFAAGFALLRSRLPGVTETVWSAFESATPERARGLGDALTWGPSDALWSRLDSAAASAAPPISVVAATSLALRRRALPGAHVRDRWLASEDPAIRRAAWRVAYFAGSSETRGLWERGLADPDAGVRQEARRAALWCRQTWILDGPHAALARGRDVDAHDVLLVAITGDRDDVPGLVAFSRDAGNGLARFRPLGTLGHPDGIEPLLKAMGGVDLLASAYAGEAFVKITGEDVDSGRRAVVPPANGREPDEFESEFLDEISLPDERRARATWEHRREELGRGARWCRGHDLSRPPSGEVLDALDRESRWEACLRGMLTGTWRGLPGDLEAYPQPNLHP